MSNIGRGVFLAGVGLFVRAAYCVIQARHALRQSGGHLDDFVLPWNVVLLVVVAAAACLAGGLKSLSGFKPIHLAEGETACWDRLHERFNFRLYATRAACVSRLVQNFVTPPPA
ncbi:hypothetical protein BESB_011270 [Besnoitia besnoiti]|uniref:Membrane magnesium transporter n=1 Tax=Besnoitia besnoiti TaxID=94643 RepID=A0A2A9ML87_BESBE|nr:hypothetical protein BESB_011270 [Besnoitia besnoiti]PFH38785.1 hypothetical protein BESB_011270 [Besnoitia besnoiti]